MLLIIAYTDSHTFLTPHYKEAAEVCGKHQRARVTKTAGGWEAKWLTTKTVTWCLDGSEDDRPAAVEFAKKSNGTLYRYSAGYNLEDAHANARDAVLRAASFDT